MNPKIINSEEGKKGKKNTEQVGQRRNNLDGGFKTKYISNYINAKKLYYILMHNM